MTKGMYGEFGGQYAPETLMIALAIVSRFPSLKPEQTERGAAAFRLLCSAVLQP